MLIYHRMGAFHSTSRSIQNERDVEVIRTAAAQKRSPRIKLQNLECFHCGQQCHIYWCREETLNNPQYCTKCLNIFCGKCSWKTRFHSPKLKLRSEENHEHHLMEDSSLYNMAYILELVPQDELKFLDSEFWGQFCITDSPDVRNPSQLEPRLKACLKELGPFIHNSPQEEEKIKETVELPALKCSECFRELNSYNPPELFADGNIKGRNCCAGSATRFRIKRNFFEFLKFSEIVCHVTDLEALTYKEWTPMKFTLCLEPFSETEDTLPKLHPPCMTVRCASCFTNTKCCNELKQDVHLITVHSMLDSTNQIRRIIK